MLVVEGGDVAYFEAKMFVKQSKFLIVSFKLLYSVNKQKPLWLLKPPTTEKHYLF